MEIAGSEDGAKDEADELLAHLPPVNSPWLNCCCLNSPPLLFNPPDLRLDPDTGPCCNSFPSVSVPPSGLQPRGADGDRRC